ncbi:arsenic resistance N-acetyltransferase ArsN2 [Parerythrobacter jejuensis]|uniref:arsenic resistance N-acetyltransferase ArsN2 n=1 Tax=Parerythrobacter jejuensis TaxID=795812 RepID=UPI002D7FC648|nr:arsenic resistance N-acetyltransferase ArsN2 [Parerythrobacter jejuensis]
MFVEPVRFKDELDALRDALAAADLPVDDIDQAGRQFLLLRDGAERLGFIGVEGEGPDRLLRSAIILPDKRGAGVGSQLVKELETFVRSDGCERLHLLTTTAEAFFARLGYRAKDRSTAPQVIAASREFAELCPGSAIYMMKTFK